MKDPKSLEYLWSTPGRRYALARCAPGNDSDLMPFDTETRCAILIEDNELAEYVVRRMLEAGLPTIDPPHEPI